MEGGGTGLKSETDVCCLGQRKGEAARRKEKGRKTEEPGREKRSHLRGISEEKKERKENKRKRTGVFSGGGRVWSRAEKKLEEEQGSSLKWSRYDFNVFSNFLVSL